MPGSKRGFTTSHTCATVDSTARNQPSEKDRKACEKLQEKVSNFHVTFNDNIYLSIGLETKCGIYNSFDPNEPYNIHMEPSSCKVLLLAIRWSVFALFVSYFFCNCARGFYYSGYALMPCDFWGML